MSDFFLIFSQASETHLVVIWRIFQYFSIFAIVDKTKIRSIKLTYHKAYNQKTCTEFLHGNVFNEQR